MALDQKLAEVLLELLEQCSLALWEPERLLLALKALLLVWMALQPLVLTALRQQAQESWAHETSMQGSLERHPLGFWVAVLCVVSLEQLHGYQAVHRREFVVPLSVASLATKVGDLLGCQVASSKDHWELLVEGLLVYPEALQKVLLGVHHRVCALP